MHSSSRNNTLASSQNRPNHGLVDCTGQSMDLRHTLRRHTAQLWMMQDADRLRLSVDVLTMPGSTDAHLSLRWHIYVYTCSKHQQGPSKVRQGGYTLSADFTKVQPRSQIIAGRRPRLISEGRSIQEQERCQLHRPAVNPGRSALLSGCQRAPLHAGVAGGAHELHGQTSACHDHGHGLCRSHAECE